MGVGFYVMNGVGGVVVIGNGDVMMRFFLLYVFLNNLILVVFFIWLVKWNLFILFFINCLFYNVILLRNVIIIEVDLILIFCIN